MREAAREANDGRPVFDSEHGPINLFKDKKVTLPEAFDDEYFRHMQWAHLASGGAGGGMRWPNRHPHVLTQGMREAQRAMAAFLPLVDWTRFHRRNLNEEIAVSSPSLAPFGCGDAEQAVVWLLRTDTIGPLGTLVPSASIGVEISVPGLAPGRFRVTPFDTMRGEAVSSGEDVLHEGGALKIRVPQLLADVAISVTRLA